MRECRTATDLAPRNIIVKGSRIAGVIDWGAAGLPEYWELSKAMWCPMLYGKDIPWESRVRVIFSDEQIRDWKLDTEISQYLVGAF